MVCVHFYIHMHVTFMSVCVCMFCKHITHTHTEVHLCLQGHPLALAIPGFSQEAKRKQAPATPADLLDKFRPAEPPRGRRVAAAAAQAQAPGPLRSCSEATLRAVAEELGLDPGQRAAQSPPPGFRELINQPTVRACAPGRWTGRQPGGIWCDLGGAGASHMLQFPDIGA